MGTVTITMSLRRAMLLAFAVGVMLGSSIGMLVIMTGSSPSGAVAADTIAADTANTTDEEADAPAENESQPSAEQDDDTVDVSNITFEDDPVLGSADAPVTVVEFSDYQCPYCRKFARQTFPKLKENYIDDGTVRFAYKDFPLRQYHPKAVPMARAASCAGDQGRYWDMHDKLYEAQQNLSGQRTARFSSDRIPEWAADIGLDMDAFTQCYNGSAYKIDVREDFRQGQDVGVSSTPTFLVYRTGADTGTTIVGAHSFSKFQSVINETLQNTADAPSDTA